MRVSVIGTGYVGLVTGCCLAEAGHQVTCIDNNQQKIADMQAGKVPIYEPGLAEYMINNTRSGRLSFTTNVDQGVVEAEVIFLALPTPPQDDGSADLSAILAVAKQLGPILPKTYCLVINKSTVPVGTAKLVREIIGEDTAPDFDVVSNPEFLREGKAVEDFMKPERVVVGVDSKKAERVMRRLYKPFISAKRPLYVTNPQTAELIKYAANAFLVTKISYMNEIAQLCERMDADIDMVRQAIGSDSRIGNKFLNAGIGSGGSCFPKDVRALHHMAQANNYDFKLLDAAIEINDQQKHALVQKLDDHFEGALSNKTFAVWGLAFKPDTDDIREAPALVIIDELLARGSKVIAYDPEAANNVRKIYKGEAGIKIANNKYEALNDADGLVIATEWPEFAKADLTIIKQRLKLPLILDGRNIYSPDDMRAAGFSYYSIGRRPVLQS